MSAPDVTPAVSVVMPVYNGERYLSDAVASILSQSLREIELIIIDDCSSDDSLRIAQGIAETDSRVRVIQTETNGGSARARNLGMEHAQSHVIAVMDSDDIAHPDRLQRQLEVMRQNPGCSLCATSTRRIDGAGHVVTSHIIDYTPAEYRWCVAFNLRISHSTLMFRAQDAAGEKVLYREDLWQSQDFDLVTRLASSGDVLCLPDILVDYRVHTAQVSQTQRMSQRERSMEIATAYQSAHLPDDICSALKPVNMALFHYSYDDVAIVDGLRLYSRHMALSEGMPKSGFNNLAALELHYLLARKHGNQLRALAAMLTLAPGWIVPVVRHKLKRALTREAMLKAHSKARKHA